MLAGMRSFSTSMSGCHISWTSILVTTYTTTDINLQPHMGRHFCMSNLKIKFHVLIWRGADKSLARSGRKQATATKLGIYSTYSPRNSIKLAYCSIFCKPLKKKFRRLSVQPGLRDSNDLRVGRKIATFQLFFFSVRGTDGSPMGPDPENRMGDKDIGSPDRTVYCGFQAHDEPGHCRARTRPSWWPSRIIGVLLSKSAPPHT